jgi:hypothetical protein
MQVGPISRLALNRLTLSRFTPGEARRSLENLGRQRAHIRKRPPIPHTLCSLAPALILLKRCIRGVRLQRIASEHLAG